MKVSCLPVLDFILLSILFIYFILFYKLNNVLSGSLPDLPSENTMIYELLLPIPAGDGMVVVVKAD